MRQKPQQQLLLSAQPQQLLQQGILQAAATLLLRDWQTLQLSSPWQCYAALAEP
jgi:hypothetical protein